MKKLKYGKRNIITKGNTQKIVGKKNKNVKIQLDQNSSKPQSEGLGPARTTNLRHSTRNTKPAGYMNTSQRKPMLSRRVEMSIDVEELQMFDGIAQCANHTLEFKIIDNQIDLLTDNNNTFHPKFTHQVFHRDETIKGMKDLNVTIYLTPTTLRPYVYW